MALSGPAHALEMESLSLDEVVVTANRNKMREEKDHE